MIEAETHVGLIASDCVTVRPDGSRHLVESVGVAFDVVVVGVDVILHLKLLQLPTARTRQRVGEAGPRTAAVAVGRVLALVFPEEHDHLKRRSTFGQNCWRCDLIPMATFSTVRFGVNLSPYQGQRAMLSQFVEEVLVGIMSRRPRGEMILGKIAIGTFGVNVALMLYSSGLEKFQK